MNLLKLIEKYEHVIENKRTDGTTIQKKAGAWGNIGHEFNAFSESGARTVQQLKLLYKNLKKHARTSVAEKKRNTFLSRPSTASRVDVENETEEVDQGQIKTLKTQDAADKKELHKTGGGRFVPQLQESGAQILALLGDRFEPLKNPHDSSAIYHGDFGVPSAASHHQHEEMTREVHIEVLDDPLAGPSWFGRGELSHDDELSFGDQALFQENYSEPEARFQISSSSASPIIPTNNLNNIAGAPASLPNRPKKLKKKKKVKIPSGEKNLKREYFATKLRLARFQLASAKIQHAIDVKIKRQQLKKVME